MEKTKTKEKVIIRLLNGKTRNCTIYVDENGNKFVYVQRHFTELEVFLKAYKDRIVE